MCVCRVGSGDMGVSGGCANLMGVRVCVSGVSMCVCVVMYACGGMYGVKATM